MVPTRHSPRDELPPVELPPGELRGDDQLTDRERDLLRMAHAVAVGVGEEDSPIGEFLTGQFLAGYWTPENFGQH